MNLKQPLLLLVLVLATLNAANANEAGGRCNIAFVGNFPSLNIEQLTRVRPDFKHDPDSYTKRLDPATPVRNQCAYGSCWIHASLKNFEYIARDKSGNIVPLSSDYLIAQNLHKEAVTILLRELSLGKKMPQFLKGLQTVNQGGFAHQAMDLINKVGVVPDAVWRSRINFTKEGQLGDRIHFQLNLMLQQFKADYRKVLSENKIDASDIQARSFDKWPEVVQKFLIEADLKIQNFIWAYTGDLPQKFTYHLNGETREFTPKTFRDEVIQYDTVTNIYPKTPTDIEQAFNLIKSEIDAGRPVWLGISWVKMFVDKKTGIMSINAFPTPLAGELKADPDRWQALVNKLHAGGRHAITITGYEVDREGKPVKLLIENSWGDDVGEHGFYHMYWDYFASFRPSVHVFRKAAPKGP